MKTGVVDVGGGLRGIYAVGVLDYCMDKGIRFDIGIGVSAGSANLVSYVAGQRGRNYQFYTEYAFRKQYMGFRNFIFKKSFVNMEYVYSTLSNSDGENPLDYDSFKKNPMEFYVVALDANTGETHYFDKNDIHQDNYDVMKASSSLPYVCPPYPINGSVYYDGALGDPVPFEKAFELGCDKVVVILTKPEDEIRTSKTDNIFAQRIEKKYPAAAEKLRGHSDKYNEQIALAKKYARQGRVLIVSPDDTCGIDTLKKNRPSMQKLYIKGYKDGIEIKKFLAKNQY